jgi:hypothetical protein
MGNASDSGVLDDAVVFVGDDPVPDPVNNLDSLSVLDNFFV